MAKTPTVRECNTCGTLFKSNRSDMLYCTSTCRNKMRKRKQREKDPETFDRLSRECNKRHRDKVQELKRDFLRRNPVLAEEWKARDPSISAKWHTHYRLVRDEKERREKNRRNTLNLHKVVFEFVRDAYPPEQFEELISELTKPI